MDLLSKFSICVIFQEDLDEGRQKTNSLATIDQINYIAPIYKCYTFLIS